MDHQVDGINMAWIALLQRCSPPWHGVNAESSTENDQQWKDEACSAQWVLPPPTHFYPLVVNRCFILILVAAAAAASES